MEKTNQTGVYLKKQGVYLIHSTVKNPLTGKIQHKRSTVSARSAVQAAKLRDKQHKR